MKNGTTIHQMLRYLISGVGVPMRRIPLLKLVYLADRYHLRKYGRLISGSEYVAMNKGPVPYEAKIETDKIQCGWEKADGLSVFKQDGHGVFSAVRPDERDMDYLSGTDREALDAAIKVAKREGVDGLVAFTHHFPEWKIAVASLCANDPESSAPMNVMDFFLDAPEGKEYCDADKELVSLQREWCGEYGV